MRFTTKVGAGLLCCAAGTITGYTTARDSFPKQPPVPGFWDVMVWLFSFQDGWAVAAALFAFFSAAYSIWEMFQPGPQTEEEARKHHDREMRSFAAADERQGERHAHDMAGHQTTQAELAALREQIAALTQAVAQTNPGQAAGFAEAAEKLVASGDESDIDLAREVAAGRPEEAADALMREVQEGKQRNAARARQAARLYAPSAPGKAKAAYVEAVALDPTDLWSWIELGRLRMAYDSLAAARQCFGAALQQVTDERDRMALHNEFGHVLMAEGQLRDARSEYEAGLAIADRLAQQEPGNAGRQNDLSVSFEKLGDVELAAGNLAAARTRYEAGLAINAWLVQQEPGNANWQNDLSISFERLGDIELDAGDLAAARTQFESKLAIDLRLVNLDASNSKWQHDLAISYSKLGDIELEAGNLVAARARFDESLTILEMLAAADPGNAEW
jgi:tetratricopeptide (TPR) repeat protein